MGDKYVLKDGKLVKTTVPVSNEFNNYFECDPLRTKSVEVKAFHWHFTEEREDENLQELDKTRVFDLASDMKELKSKYAINSDVYIFSGFNFIKSEGVAEALCKAILSDSVNERILNKACLVANINILKEKNKIISHMFLTKGFLIISKFSLKIFDINSCTIPESDVIYGNYISFEVNVDDYYWVKVAVITSVDEINLRTKLPQWKSQWGVCIQSFMLPKLSSALKDRGQALIITRIFNPKVSKKSIRKILFSESQRVTENVDFSVKTNKLSEVLAKEYELELKDRKLTMAFLFKVRHYAKYRKTSSLNLSTKVYDFKKNEAGLKIMSKPMFDEVLYYFPYHPMEATVKFQAQYSNTLLEELVQEPVEEPVEEPIDEVAKDNAIDCSKDIIDILDLTSKNSIELSVLIIDEADEKKRPDEIIKKVLKEIEELQKEVQGDKKIRLDFKSSDD